MTNSQYTVVEKPISVKLVKDLNPQLQSEDQVINYMILTNSIDFSKQHITTLDGLDMFLDLNKANLSQNMIYQIKPIILDILVNLEFLDISNNNIQQFPDLSKTKIKHLNISHNPISQLNLEFIPKQIQELGISGLDIEKQAILQKFPSLKFIETQKAAVQQVCEIEKQLDNVGYVADDMQDIKPSQSQQSNVRTQNMLKQSSKLQNQSYSDKNSSLPPKPLSAIPQFQPKTPKQLTDDIKNIHQKIQNQRDLKVSLLSSYQKSKVDSEPKVQQDQSKKPKIQAKQLKDAPKILNKTVEQQAISELQQQKDNTKVLQDELSYTQQMLKDKYFQLLQEIDKLEQSGIKQQVDKLITQSKKRTDEQQIVGTIPKIEDYKPDELPDAGIDGEDEEESEAEQQDGNEQQQ